MTGKVGQLYDILIADELFANNERSLRSSRP